MNGKGAEVHCFLRVRECGGRWRAIVSPPAHANAACNVKCVKERDHSGAGARKTQAGWSQGQWRNLKSETWPCGSVRRAMRMPGARGAAEEAAEKAERMKK